MEIRMIVLRQEATREFPTTENGVTKQAKVVDLHLVDGLNQMVVSAFGETAQTLTDHPLQPGQTINADLTFSVGKFTTKDGREASMQRVRLNKYGVLS